MLGKGLNILYFSNICFSYYRCISATYRKRTKKTPPPESEPTLLMSSKQPDEGRIIAKAEYSFLVLEIAHSEADKTALTKQNITFDTRKERSSTS